MRGQPLTTALHNRNSRYLNFKAHRAGWKGVGGSAERLFPGFFELTSFLAVV